MWQAHTFYLVGTKLNTLPHNQLKQNPNFFLFVWFPAASSALSLSLKEHKISGYDIGKSDNCNTNKNLEFNETDMAYLELVKGLKFGDVATFREAVREANLIKGKDLRFVKNNKDKVIVRCKAEGCKYKAMVLYHTI